MQFDEFFFKHFKVEFLLNNACRECNFAMGTIMGKPFPMIVPMAKLDIYPALIKLKFIKKKKEITAVLGLNLVRNKHPPTNFYLPYQYDQFLQISNPHLFLLLEFCLMDHNIVNVFGPHYKVFL